MNNPFNSYIIFGRKKGKNKKINYQQLYNKFLLDLNTDFLNKKIILDIGSGNGENTIYLSQKFPDKLIIAAEVYQDGIINLCKVLQKNKINNVKIFDHNVLLLIENKNLNFLLDDIWILFPDPWPKKKHNKRRLINENFLKKISILIKPKGKIFIVTDSIQYFISILSDINKTNIFRWINDKAKNWHYSYQKIPKTRYFQKAIYNNRKAMIVILSKI